MKLVNVLIVILIVFSAVAKSGTYKWVDSDGRIHYTDKPQPKDRNAVSLKIKEDIGPRESARAKARLIELQEQQKEQARLNKINNKIRKKKRAKAHRRQTLVKKNCGRARRNIKTLNSKSWAPIRNLGPNGSPHGYITVKQRPAEIKKNQDYIKRNC